ncbi:MAG: metallophosphoesterase [Haloarculaceae archaeon]
MVPGHTDGTDGKDSTDEQCDSRPSGTDAHTGDERGSSALPTVGKRGLRLLATVLVAGLLVVSAGAGGALAVAPTAGAGAMATPTMATGDTQPAAENGSALTVAFIADAGMSDDTRDVLNLIADEGADVVVYSGDFDYADDPQAWADMLDRELGPDVPVVAVMGNHDVERWDDYQQVIREGLNRSDAVQCTGDLGWQSTCTMDDLTVVQSGVGMCNYNDPSKADYIPERCADYDTADDESYVADQLANATTTWKVCSWHLVNGRYQLGDKESLVPASLYDTCREGGAIVATGHDHTYARTYPMANFSTETVADRSPPYTVGNGSSFAFISAAAGQSFYDPTDLVDEPYWNATHTDGEFGAFFCTLRPDGTGECYFETVSGDVVDGPFAIRQATTNETATDQQPTPTPDTGNTTAPDAGTDTPGAGDGTQNETTTVDDSAGTGSAALPNTLVVDGRGTGDVTTYAFTVTGDVERVADASTADGSSPWDRIADVAADGEAVGVVGEGVDVYRFSGDIVVKTVDGDAGVSVEMV